MGYATNYTTELSGSYWSGDEVTGEPVILTYSFLTSEPTSDPHNLGSTVLNSFAAFTPDQQAQTEQALARWSGVSGVIFEEVPAGEGDINFAAYNLAPPGGEGGEGFFPWGNWNYSTETSSTIHFAADMQASGYGDVLMNTSDEDDGLFAYPTLLHEIGHALGLKHPTDPWTDTVFGKVKAQWNPKVPYNPNFSIMSPGGLGSTLTDITSDDVLAIQSVYGTAADQMDQYASWSWDSSTYTLTGTLKSGTQTVRGASVNNRITGAGGKDTVYAIGQGTNYIYGKGGNDVLIGGSGVNYLDGGVGADTLNGWFSPNTYASYADSASGLEINLANPTLNTGDALGDVYVDVHNVLGSSHSDTIFGDNNGDILAGGAGDDMIAGGSSDDIITGGLGADVLTGGAGANQFNYNAPNEGGDTIADFSAAQDDLITVSHAGFKGGLTAGVLPASHFALNAPTAATGQFVWNAALHELFWYSKGNAAGSVSTLIATLDNVTTFAASSIKVT